MSEIKSITFKSMDAYLKAVKFHKENGTYIDDYRSVKYLEGFQEGTVKYIEKQPAEQPTIEDFERLLEENARLQKESDRHARTIAKIVEAADKAGWNGVTNSKQLWTFVEDLGKENARLKVDLEGMDNTFNRMLKLAYQVLHEMKTVRAVAKKSKDLPREILSDLKSKGFEPYLLSEDESVVYLRDIKEIFAKHGIED